MADIASAASKINDVEVAQNKPTSEALFTKIGANVNYLIDKGITMELKTSSGSWVCPSNVTKVLVVGVGGGGPGGEGAPSAEGIGVSGGATIFDGDTISAGGIAGRPATLETSQTNSSQNRYWFGAGSGGGGSGSHDRTGGDGGEGWRINGTEYGAGGNGGAGLVSAIAYPGGGGGAGGKLGFKSYTVVPDASYAYTIGAQGNNATGGSGGNGGNGSAGALMIIYTV